MWDKAIKHLGKFPNAVLTGIDAGGYPFSLRCTPKLDEDRKVLLISRAGEVPIQPGPANLLYHYHNDQLWDLKAILVTGSLEQVERGWVFHPERFILSGGLMGPIDQIRFIGNARAETGKYLQKRGLPRPKIAWDEFAELKAEIKRTG